MNCVEKKKISGASFEDRVIFHGFQISFDGGGPYVPPQSVFIFFTKNPSPWPNPETHL